MPSKTTKGGANKTHNRGSSASSTSKLNLNVAFPPNKSSERIKRNTSDHQLARNTSPYPRESQKRVPLSPTKRAATVIQVDIGGGDDDEWVSSESGAATPADYEEEDVPPSPDDHAEEELEPAPSTTPRGDPPPRPPPPPIPRPRPQSLADLPRVDTVTKFTTQANDSPSSDSVTMNPPTPIHRPSNRHSLTRPPSMRSGHSARPHPLIRARSYAPSTPTLVAPPTLTSGSTQVHASPATPSPTASPRKGQGYGQTPVTRSPSSEHHYSHYQPRLKRQGSHSSVTSVATLPLPTTASAATASTTRVHGERQRTLSHASTSAALSSLNAATHPHAPSRPPSPLLTIAFPPVNPRGEHAHIMIPPPLVPPHVSATAHQNPILEALQRVAEAKAKAGR